MHHEHQPRCMYHRTLSSHNFSPSTCSSMYTVVTVVENRLYRELFIFLGQEIDEELAAEIMLSSLVSLLFSLFSWKKVRTGPYHPARTRLQQEILSPHGHLFDIRHVPFRSVAVFVGAFIALDSLLIRRRPVPLGPSSSRFRPIYQGPLLHRAKRPRTARGSAIVPRGGLFEGAWLLQDEMLIHLVCVFSRVTREANG